MTKSAQITAAKIEKDEREEDERARDVSSPKSGRTEKRPRFFGTEEEGAADKDDSEGAFAAETEAAAGMSAGIETKGTEDEDEAVSCQDEGCANEGSESASEDDSAGSFALESCSFVLSCGSFEEALLLFV